MSLFASGRDELASLEPGKLYNVRIRIDIQSASLKAEDNSQ